MILGDFYNAWDHPSVAPSLAERWLVGPLFYNGVLPVLAEGLKFEKVEEISEQLLTAIKENKQDFFGPDKITPEQPENTAVSARRMAAVIWEYLLRTTKWNHNGNGNGHCNCDRKAAR
jgi:hypothetical protein